MRVYEFAKQKKLSSKDILTLSEKLGLDVASHMSVLSDDAVAVLTKALAPKPPEKKTRAEAKPRTETKPRVEVRPIKKTVPTRKIIKKEPALEAPKKVLEIAVREDLPLYRAALLMGRSEGELILALLKNGIPCNRNHILSVSSISDLAHHFGIKVIIPERKKELVQDRLEVEEVMALGKEARWPIVVVMGHVDHGKTTLLDYVRKMNVAAKEKGGITQHLSAYEVDSVHGKIVFLDTPGHEAFSYMRKRGTSVTDIVVLVVAADDGVMPQTVEVIKHAKAAAVPIVVAINKVDKVDPAVSVERVKRQLAQYDLLAEDWGGDVICVPISAKTGQGVEELLEMVVLQAQMMDLKADPTASARGFVLESKQEKGLGPVATVICLNGTINVGDYFVCGSSIGKVRLLIDSFGKRVSFAGPSIPVQVVGFDSFVSLGDWLTVVSFKEYLKEKAIRKKEPSIIAPSECMLFLQAGVTPVESIPLLVKTDTHGSREAILGAIGKVNKAYPEIPAKYHIIYSGIGATSERDVDFAAQAGALLIALHVKTEKNAILLAKELGVDVKEFEIIYKMTEMLETLLQEYEEEVVTLKKKGEAVVRKVFDLGKKGVIAGCYVSDGVFARGNIVVCIRDGKEVGKGKIVSLQRERKAVKEVHTGFECGFITDSFHGWEVGDMVHCFVEEKKKRSEM